MTGEIEVEASGETVGEAKWHALRELERLSPGLDKASVRFEVLAEGERGLLGVGYAPARVRAVAGRRAVPERAAERPSESERAAGVRELLEEIARAIGAEFRVDVEEREEEVTASLTGGDLGLVIGRHGQTIDAIQYLVNAIGFREGAEKAVAVDAGGYRERRRVQLESLAVRSAERASSAREPIELEPMSALERRIVHLRLKEFEGVSTRSEGDEPNRYVVVVPD